MKLRRRRPKRPRPPGPGLEGGSEGHALLRADAREVRVDVERDEVPLLQLCRFLANVLFQDYDLALPLRRRWVVHVLVRLDPAVGPLPRRDLAGHRHDGDALAAGPPTAAAPWAAPPSAAWRAP